MPKVKGPLFSLSTWGTFAGLLTFQRRRGMTTVYLKPTPRIPLTELQLSQRASVASAVSSWHALPDASKALWHEAAFGMKLSGYNMYVQNYLLELIA